MALNVHIEKNNNETSVNVLRRFSRKVRAIGFLRAKRAKRYFKRQDSALRMKRSALAKIETRKEYAHMRKMGKISER